MVVVFLFLRLRAAYIADPGLYVVALADVEAPSEAGPGVAGDLDNNGYNFNLNGDGDVFEEGFKSAGDDGVALVDYFGNDSTTGGGDETDFNSNDADSVGLDDGYDNYGYGYDSGYGSYVSEYYYSGESSEKYSNGDAPVSYIAIPDTSCTSHITLHQTFWLIKVFVLVVLGCYLHPPDGGCDGTSEHEHAEKAALLDFPIRSWSNNTMPCADFWRGVSCDGDCRVESL
jgi:hypothetical protein